LKQSLSLTIATLAFAQSPQVRLLLLGGGFSLDFGDIEPIRGVRLWFDLCNCPYQCLYRCVCCLWPNSCSLFAACGGVVCQRVVEFGLIGYLGKIVGFAISIVLRSEANSALPGLLIRTTQFDVMRRP